MTNTKETIYANLFAQVSSSVTGVLTSGRRVKHYDELQPDEQPAFFLEQTNVTVVGEGPKPGRQVVRANLIFYAVSDSDVGPMQTINSLVNQAEASLRRKSTEGGDGWTTTLSGTVTSTRIVSIEYAGGNLGTQGVGIVGVEMITVG